MARYKKKPVVIEAIQWDGLNLEEIRRFVGSSLVYEIFDAAWKAGAGQPVVDMKIKTLEGEMQVGRGDYIIKGVRGEFYPCKPDIFKETYASADTADVVPKSEIENKYYFDAKKADESLNKLISNAKADVAREIFEEVEKAIDGYQLGYKIAELKKKYTEGGE